MSFRSNTPVKNLITTPGRNQEHSWMHTQRLSRRKWKTMTTSPVWTTFWASYPPRLHRPPAILRYQNMEPILQRVGLGNCNVNSGPEICSMNKIPCILTTLLSMYRTTANSECHVDSRFVHDLTSPTSTNWQDLTVVVAISLSIPGELILALDGRFFYPARITSFNKNSNKYKVNIAPQLGGMYSSKSWESHIIHLLDWVCHRPCKVHCAEKILYTLWERISEMSGKNACIQHLNRFAFLKAWTDSSIRWL